MQTEGEHVRCDHRRGALRRLADRLYQAMRAAGITKAELARRIGIAPQQAQRLFDTNHASRTDQLAAAFAALGRRLVITSEAA